jgi:hypothetical protein
LDLVAKKKSSKQIQDDLRQLSKPNSEAPAAPTFEWKKTLVRAGGAIVALWVVCAMVGSFLRTNIPLYVAAAVTVAAVGVFIWLSRMMKKQQALTQILASADTEEGRKQALEKLGTDYKKDDAQAALARAQLQMQDDPKAALATLEAVDLDKQMAPVASQIRAMRAMLHLTMGEPQEAKKLVDKLDLSKQQDAKVRAMFATVAGVGRAPRTAGADVARARLRLCRAERHQRHRPRIAQARRDEPAAAWYVCRRQTCTPLART